MSSETHSNPAIPSRSGRCLALVVENLDKSQKSEGTCRNSGGRRNVLRRISTFVFYLLARQTRSPNCIDWACKIL